MLKIILCLRLPWFGPLLNLQMTPCPKYNEMRITQADLCDSGACIYHSNLVAMNADIW